MGMAINPSQLEAFHAVAVEGSVTRGAERLLITQPAVTRAIRSLERSLKTDVFERLPRGVRLTEAGRVLFDHTIRIFGLLQDAEQAIVDVRGLHHGRLRIGATPSLATHLLPSVLVRMRRRFPDVDVRFEVENAKVLFDRIDAGVLELGVTDAVDLPEGLASTRVGGDPLIGIAARSLHKNKPKVALDEFCGNGLIVRRADGARTSFVERLLAARMVSVAPKMTLGSAEAVKRAVAAGLGVAIVGRMTVDLDVKAKELRVVQIEGLNAERPFFVVRRIGSRESKPAVAFGCLLRDEWRSRLRRYRSSQ